MGMAGSTPAPDETCLSIIALVAEGHTVGSAVAEVEPDEKKRSNLQRKFFAGLAKSDNLSQNYARAQRSRAQAQFERIGEIAEQVLDGKLDPQAARVAIDAWKWTTGRQDPKKYGEKIQLEDATPKPALSREETLAQLRASGLSVADVFATLTKPAEPLTIEVGQDADGAELDDDPPPLDES